jgi:ribosomal-protein-alanine N-acetyltransferase
MFGNSIQGERSEHAILNQKHQNRQSAKADFVSLLQRIHSPVQGWLRDLSCCHCPGHLSTPPLTSHPTREPPLILRTERLVLREFTADDWPATLAYENDPRYLRFYERDGVTERQCQALIYQFILWQGEQPRARAQLAITLAATGELIGNVGLRRETAQEPLADMGFELSPDHWGRGYATEAARAMVDWGFGEWGLDRVHAHCVSENAASARVLERVGMRLEARLRDHQRFKGRFWGLSLYGLLRAEWEASRTVSG